MWRRILKIVGIIVVLSLVISIEIVTNVSASNIAKTIVAISPSSLDVIQGNSYAVNIYVNPSVAIAGMQVSVSFDSTIIRITDIEEGNLFSQNMNSEPTFFTSGEINNSVGTINNISDVIIGNNTISSNGMFASILFIAKETGSVDFTLSNVIVGFTLQNVIEQNIQSIEGIIPIEIEDSSDPVITTTDVERNTTLPNQNSASSLAESVLPILLVVIVIVFLVIVMTSGDITLASIVTMGILIIISVVFLGILNNSF